MSTLALLSADAAVEPSAKPSLFQRLIQAREKEALRHIQQFLNWQSDERLQNLGYTAEDIAAIRQGGLAVPAR